MHWVGEGVIKRYKVSQERRHLEAFGGIWRHLEAHEILAEPVHGYWLKIKV